MEGRPNPNPKSGEEICGYSFTEEMLTFETFANIFATEIENPLNNKHCFCCMFCTKKTSMESRGFFELKR